MVIHALTSLVRREPPAACMPPAKTKPSEWFQTYTRLTSVYGNARPVSAPVLQSRDASSRYQRSNRNPGVGYDGKRKKFTLMVMENGVDKPFGSFLTEDEGVQGYAGMCDKNTRGPHGIEGIPRTNKRDGVAREVLMELNGPPGAQLHPPGHWQQNKGSAEQQARTNVNVGKWTTPQSRPTSASLLAHRPVAARRQRPSTALLRNKGQWSGVREDNLHECVRNDICGAATDGERVEYNPDIVRRCWAGGWNDQRLPVGIPYND